MGDSVLKSMVCTLFTPELRGKEKKYKGRRFFLHANWGEKQ